MSGFHPKRTLALPIAPTETDAVSIADETGLAAVVSQVPECLLSAFLVVIDATNDQSPHGLVSEDHVVCFINGDVELLSRPLH